MEDLEHYKRLVADNVRCQRLTLGLTQEALSSLSGVSRSSIAALEQGMGNPSLENLYHVATALNLDLNQLFAE